MRKHKIHPYPSSVQRYVFVFICYFIFCPAPIFSFFEGQKEVSIGPEICYLKRAREGGTKQSGTLYGFRLNFDRLARCKYYYGLEGAYSSGILNGKSGTGNKLKSSFSQSNIEGRLGYTFQSKGGEYMSITPYFSAGYYLELNYYKNPSPVKVHFKNSFSYGGAGCLLRGSLRPRLHFGLNVTARFSFDGKIKTSHDPDFESATLKYMQKTQCRVSLPLSYQCQNSSFFIDCVPFYEYRQYGKKRAIPFDFLDTRIQCWGVDIMCSYVF